MAALTLDEMRAYLAMRLKGAFKAHAIEGPMDRDYDDPAHGYFACDPKKVAVIDSPLRVESGAKTVNELIELNLR